VSGRTYDCDPVWPRIQEFLPEECRLTADNMPDEEYVAMSGRFSVHIDHYVPDEAKTVLVVLHGVGGNGRLLSFVAAPLAKRGYEVVCPDLPMYGLTEYAGTVTYDDWAKVAAGVAERYRRNGLPLYVFGLSAGGLLAYETACRTEGVNGLMATCLLDQRIPEVTRNTSNNILTAVLGKQLLGLMNRRLGSLKLPMKSVCNMKAIVNNEEIAEILMADRLSSGASVSLEFLHGMLNPVLTTEPEDFAGCPVMLAQPEMDRWTEERLSRLFLNRMDKRRVHTEVVRLPGAGHFPIEETGLDALVNVCDRFMSEQEGENR